MILSFVRHNYSDIYSTIVFARDMYYKTLYATSQADTIDAAEMQKLIKVMNDIEDLKKRLLNGDETRLINVSLVQKMEIESLGLRPEDVAAKIRKGDKILKTDLYA